MPFKTLSPIFILYGPPAAGVATITLQLPSAAETAVYFMPLHETVTVTRARLPAHPHNATVLRCCNTILSPMTAGNRISARTPAERKSTINNKTLFLMS
jgi:hypothetical protein